LLLGRVKPPMSGEPVLRMSLVLPTIATPRRLIRRG
jgi:hypothetical protein